MSRVKRLIYVAMSVIFLLSVCMIALGAKSGETEVEIYAAPATVKYRIDEEISSYYKDGVAHIQAAVNEYEAVQVIMKAGTRVRYFDAFSSDLVSRDNAEQKISADNIEIFYEHYINVYKQTNSYFPIGYYPDAIIPLENVVQKGENSIEAGNNQALWYRVFVPEGTPAGIYAGKVTLIIDGQKREVPVELEVYPVDITRVNHNKTSFNTWGVNGDYRETNANGHLYANTELYTKYYNMLKEYRIAASEIPTLDLLEPEIFAEELVQYAADPMVSSYNIPSTTHYVVKNGKGYGVLNTETMEETLRCILDVSIRENLDMLAKAFLYIPYLDEPQADAFWAVIQSSEDFEALRVRMCEEYRAEYAGTEKAAFVDTLLDSLMAVPNLITIVDVNKINALEGYVDAWCPIADNWQTASGEIFLEERIDQGDKMWWYTCNTPKYPYPSYHIDDNLLGSRLLSWMQMSKNVSGNLLWCTNLYGFSNWGETLPRDVWEDPIAWITAAGDGYLLYPGLKYGIDGPIASIRLESIRDGMEEYEYLYIIQQELASLAEKYDIALDVNSYVQTIYDRLFANMMPIVDAFEVLDAKRELAELIAALQAEDIHAVVSVDGVNASRSSATVSVVAEKGSTVKINGREIAAGGESGSGVRFSATLPLTDASNVATVEISNGGKTVVVHRGIGSAVSSVNSGNDAAAVGQIKTTDDIALSHNTDAAFVSEGTGSVRCVISGKPELGISYIPTLMFTSEEGFALGGYDNFAYFEADVYNDTDGYVKFSLSTETNVGIGTAFVPPKSWKRIKIYVNGTVTKDTKTIYLETDNTASSDEPIVLYIDNVGFSFQ